MIEVLPYSLPDFQIFNEDRKDYVLYVWQPDNTYLILGTSNKAEHSLIVENVLKDKIKVYKRPSGGETVILSPKTLVISTVVYSEKFAAPKIYFDTANNFIISVLAGLGIRDLRLKGISDIAIGEKKILGSSIYRRNNRNFYHAVLNLGEKVEIIEKYIAHPRKEPDYRLGRPHRDFVTSLCQEGYDIEVTDLIKALHGKNAGNILSGN